MHNDLISRSALLNEHSEKCYGECCYCTERDDESGECGLIRYAPAVDAEPVRHGHWVEIEESETGHLMECSICNNWIFHNFNYVSKYCPDCGSKMDLE